MTQPELPDMLSVGSTPRLQFLCLVGIPFPKLPTILLSTHDLVELVLWKIPKTGYISPEAMVTGVSALAMLQKLTIEFESLTSLPDPRNRRPPPLTHAILPTLTYFRFHGASEYLEDLVAQIDAPQLEHIRVTFFYQLIFDIRHLPAFISHSGMFSSFDYVKMIFSSPNVEICLRSLDGTSLIDSRLDIRCRGLDWQLSSMAQICTQFSFHLSTVEQLDIVYHGVFWNGEADVDKSQWLELFQSFTAVRTLRISHKLQSLVVSALQDLTGETTAEVLPTLDGLFLDGPGHEPSASEQQAMGRLMGRFIASRQSSGHPVAIHRLPNLW
jgi:hypothetical protein